MDNWIQFVIGPIGFKQCKKSQWNSWWTNNSHNLRKNKIRRDNAHEIVQFHGSIKNLNMKVIKPLPSTSKLEQNLLSFTFMHINVSIIFKCANLLCQFYFPKELPMWVIGGIVVLQFNTMLMICFKPGFFLTMFILVSLIAFFFFW